MRPLKGRRRGHVKKRYGRREWAQFREQEQRMPATTYVLVHSLLTASSSSPTFQPNDSFAPASVHPVARTAPDMIPRNPGGIRSDRANGMLYVLRK
jgi:hypothetical protein